jgi:hypothetical protein
VQPEGGDLGFTPQAGERSVAYMAASVASLRHFCNSDHTGYEADAEALKLATGPTSARLLDWATQPAANGP